MPFTFIVVCEAAADFRTATGLAERLIRDEVPWMGDDWFVQCPLWHGADQTRSYILWTEVESLARAAGIPPLHGHFDGRPAEPDARIARRVLRLFKKWTLSGRPIDGILLIRDDDRDTRRRTGLEQARDSESDLHRRIVIGLAHCKRECWVLAGYDPAEVREEAQLAQIRADLGFDPRTSAHQLTAKHDADKRSAKRVLGLLTEGNSDREAHCWEKAPLITLLERGRETGLADYLDQIRSRLVPLFVDRVPR